MNMGYLARFFLGMWCQVSSAIEVEAFQYLLMVVFCPGYHCDIISPIITKVSNKSAGVKFIYDSSCFGDPGHPEEDMIFLSHWNSENQLKGGDELKVSIFMRAWFE